MTQTIDIAATAEALAHAYQTREAVEPLTDSHPDLTVETAYAIQLAQVDRWRVEGRRITGYKIGLTSAAMQRQLGISEPDFGHLFHDVGFTDGATVSVAHFLSPKVEPEIGLVLATDLTGPGLTVDDVTAAVRGVVPAIEIIDSRVRDWRIRLADTVADNASFGGYVLGSTIVPLSDVDIVTTVGEMRRNGELIDSGPGSAVLGSSLNALVWLANRMGELGTTLVAESIILPGSVCSAAPVAAGDTIEVWFSGLGPVTVVWEQ